MGIQSANNSLRNFKLGLFKSASGVADALLEGLTWYYELEEAAGIRLDSSINDLNLSETGTVGNIEGVLGEAAKFNGLSTNNVSHVFNSAYVLSDFTFTGWFKITDKSASREIQYIGTGADSNNQRILSIDYENVTDSFKVALSDGSVADIAREDINGSIPINAYIFYAVRWDNTSQTLEIRLDSQAFTSFAFARSPHNPGTQSFVLGSNVSGGDPWVTSLDEIGGWNRKLTDAEVEFLFNGGPNNLMQTAIWYYRLDVDAPIQTDSSNSALDLTEIGVVGIGAGIIGNAASFPGANNNHFTHANDSIYSLTTDFTIIAWVDFDTLVATQTLVYIGNGGGGSANNVVNFRYDSGTDCIRGSLSNGTSNTNIDQQIAATIPAGQFIFIALRYDSVAGQAFLRLNNQADTQVAFVGPLNNPGNQSFSIGSLFNGSNPTDGLIDEVGGWGGFLNNAEIDTLYNSGLAARPEFGAAKPNLRNFILNDDGSRVQNADSDFVIT